MSAATATRSVLVTGASTGIGRASVAELVANGFHVWATVRRDEDALSLSTEHGTAVTPLIMDLLDEPSVRRAAATVLAAGPLHGLVNNAGVAIPSPLEMQSVDDFRAQLEINLVRQLLVTQALLPALLRAAEQNGTARIVFIGSISGRLSGPVLGAYSAAKHGVVALASSLRAELAPFGVKVALIEPGVIATPIWSTAAAAASTIDAGDDEVTRRYAGQIAGARLRASRGASGAPAALVARAVRKVMTARNPVPRQVVGRDAVLGALLVRVLPFRAVYRLVAARS